MNDITSAGYRERPHTADWELEVWAPDFLGLLGKAAEGMFALQGIQPDEGCLNEQQPDLEAEDAEGLLVAFLNELIFIGERDNAVCKPGKMSLDGWHLHSVLFCTGIISRSKEIKAVTWHNLKIHQEAGHYRTVIVFDV